MNLEIIEIMKMIPHRYPFLLIDRIVECNPQENAIAIKNVTINEEFFNGHFPGKPIMPGVLIIEAMAQTCAVCALAAESEQHCKPVYFTGIEKAKFRKPVVPGDTLYIHAHLLRKKLSIWSFQCKALRAEQVVAEAQIQATIDTST